MSLKFEIFLWFLNLDKNIVPVPFFVNLLEINPLLKNSTISCYEKHVSVSAP